MKAWRNEGTISSGVGASSAITKPLRAAIIIVALQGGRGKYILAQLRDAPADATATQEASDFDPSDLDLDVVRRVWDLAEARQVKSALDDASIPSYLGLENIENVEEFDSSFDGGVDLRVRGIDQQRALAVLSQLPTSEPQTDTDNQVPCCPRCHSPDIVFQGLDATQEAKSSFDSKFNWSCDSCGHQWRDDGIEQETSLKE